MIKEDTTNTAKCASCGAEVPVAALLCPRCGRPNISSAFTSTGSSLFAPAAELPSPGEAAVSTAPPIEATPPIGPAAEHIVPQVRTRVAIPSQAAEQAAPAQRAGQPAPYLAVISPEVAAQQLRDRLKEIERERIAALQRSRKGRQDRHISPPKVWKGLLWMAVIGAALWVWFFFAEMRFTDDLSLLLAAVIPVALALYPCYRTLDYLRRASQYEQADRRLSAEQKDILDRLHRLAEHDPDALREPTPAELLDRLSEIDRERAALAQRSSVRGPNWRMAPPTTLNGWGMLGLGAFFILFGLVFFTLTLHIGDQMDFTGLLFVAVGVFLIVMGARYYRRASEYERADRPYMRERLDILERLRRMGVQVPYGPYPGNGAR